MDFDENDHSPPASFHEPRPGPEPRPASPPPVMMPYPVYPPAPPRGNGWRVLWRVLFGLSVLANIGLFLLLFSAIVMVAAGGTGTYRNVLREGPRDSRIAVININGLIDGGQAEEVYRQMEATRHDRAVKGVIVRIDSPGGTISASDRIYQEILAYRKRGLPVVAFRHGTSSLSLPRSPAPSASSWSISCSRTCSKISWASSRSS
jgi:hypothetical protein